MPLTNLEARVCVVGSGAGGAVAASTTAAAGIATILLEEGPHHLPESFDQREDPMMARLYAEGGRRTNEDQSVVILSGRGLGGSTIHNTGLCVPPPPAVIDAWCRAGALAWRSEEVHAVAQEVLSAMGAVTPHRSEINANNAVLLRGAEALGLAWEVPLHNRARGCSGCGFCILGCAYNRKRHVLFSHLESAVRDGLSIVTGARVTRVVRDRDRWAIEGDGFRVRAERVILAGSALGTPVILLRSGLGPRRLVGRTLRLHPFAPVVGVFPEPIEAWRGVPQSVLVTGHASFLRGEEAGYVIMAAAAGPGAIGAFAPGCGREVTQAMELYPHLAVGGVLLHDATKGVVRARSDGLPRIRYWPNAEDRAELRRGIITLARMHFRAGARRVILPFQGAPKLESEAGIEAACDRPLRRYDITLNSVHPQGSVAMGSDPRRSALTPRGEVRGAPGVFVADGSLFPTSVGVPPQVTIMTLAALVARGVLEGL